MKRKPLAIGLIIAAALWLCGCSPPGHPSPGGKPPDNSFSLETARPGDTCGEFTVYDVKREYSYTTVYFKGDTEISGKYSSDWQGMFGEYVTLRLDKQSKSKVPVLEDNNYDIVLDPAIPENRAVIEIFGDTGTSGSFKIKISGFTATNYIESFTRTAVLSEAIEVKKEKYEPFKKPD